MPFPKTEKELAGQGYEYKNMTACKGCGALMEWWKTPKGKMIPLNPGTLEPHWSGCPKAKEFRK
jgi:hypothetical protein